VTDAQVICTRERRYGSGGTWPAAEKSSPARYAWAAGTSQESGHGHCSQRGSKTKMPCVD